MKAFNVGNLNQQTDELVRNAESGQFSVVNKQGKPLFVAIPFTDGLLASGVLISLADKLVKGGELSVASGAKLACMPYALYLQHLGAMGYSYLDESTNLAEELVLLNLQ